MAANYTDKLRGGPLQETEVSIPPTSSEDRALSRLNQNYRLSKAQQILRLLKDQDDLNQRFRDCDLLDDDDDSDENVDEFRHERRRRRQAEGDDDEDAWSVQEENYSQDGSDDDDDSENEAQRRAAHRMALRKHRSSIDPGRCKTSMGFYNQAEVTEVPYDTDSDHVSGLDSACSTPRGPSGPGNAAGMGGVAARGTGARKQFNVYGDAGSGRAQARHHHHRNHHHHHHQQQHQHHHNDNHYADDVGGNVSGKQNARLRVYQLQMGDSDVAMRELAIPDECMVQSARSTRPKTSLATASSAARSGRYYRQQPAPDTRHRHNTGAQNQASAHHHSHNHYHHHIPHGQSQGKLQQQQQQQHNALPGSRAVGETRQAIISRLDPHHPMVTRPFLENNDNNNSNGISGAREEVGLREEVLTPRSLAVAGYDYQALPSPSSLPSTPLQANHNAAYNQHPGVTVYEMTSNTSNHSPARAGNSKRGTGGGGVNRPSSFKDHGRSGGQRNLLSIDSPPVDLVSPRGPPPSRGPLANRELSPNTPSPGRARPHSSRVKKRVGEMPRGTVHPSPLQVLSDRGHPLAMMKLPPLDSPVSNGGSSRDLVCVGKD